MTPFDRHADRRRGTRWGRVFACAVVGLLATWGGAATVGAAPEPLPGEGDFVGTRGTEFYLAGKPFRYIGGNNYPLVQANHNERDLDAFFAQCQANHIRVIRTWAFNQDSPATAEAGDFVRLDGKELRINEAALRSLDLVTARAGAAGVKLIIVLQNQWGGSRAEWCRWSNLRHGTACDTEAGDDFYTEPAVIGDFQEYVRQVVTRTNTRNGRRYLDDPTIFAWELVNEARYSGNNDRQPDKNVGSIASDRVKALTAWFAAMSAFVKTLDGRHLVGTGSVGQYADYVPHDPIHNGSGYGLDYKLQQSLPSIDYFDFHLYPYGDAPGYGMRAYGQAALGNDSATPTREGLRAQLRQYVEDAHAAGKPVTIGEYGVDRRNVSTRDPLVAFPRAQSFAEFAADWFGASGNGLTVWHFSNLMDDDNFNVLPGKPHTGVNALGNINDDDRALLKALADAVPPSTN